ncbi:MAG: hypothetical protein U0075_14850 [Thermomicrobiales bacterium]
MAIHEVLGVGAVAVAMVGYVPYFCDVLQGKTRPHTISWLLWGLLAGIAFLGQVSGNAGSGAWVTGFTAVMSLVVFVLSLFKGTRDVVLADWLSLGGAGIALVLWYLTSDPLLSVAISTAINALAFFPTCRKSWRRPREETVVMYFLSGLKFVLALLSLQTLSLLTTLFPLSLVLMNWLFVVMLLVPRRRVDARVSVPAGLSVEGA